MTYPPVFRNYVKTFVKNFLLAIPKSREYEETYGELASHLKAKSSREINRIADKTTDYILENSNALDDWEDSVEEAFLVEAISRALDE